jgi:hypothetical protein
MTPAEKTTFANSTPRQGGWIVAAMVGALLIAGCASSGETGKGQAFANLERVKTEFRRGKTTKADVLLILGQPDGTGGFGGFAAARVEFGGDKGPEEVWYYENVKSQIGGKAVKQEQNLLMIFFGGDTFAGFMSIKTTAKGKLTWK